MTTQELIALAEKHGASHPTHGTIVFYPSQLEAFAAALTSATPAGEGLSDALRTIAEWRLPPTGKFWDEEKTRPVSYGVEYGSNGERDYMKAIASAALAASPVPKADERGSEPHPPWCSGGCCNPGSEP